MKIELRNVKTYPRNSEETAAFNASVYVDGKRVGEASNSGRGEANRLEVPRDIEEKMSAFCKTLPPSGDLPMDLDFFISLQVTRHDVAKIAKTMMAGRIVFINDKDELMQTKKLPPDQIERVRGQLKDVKILTLDELVERLLNPPPEKPAAPRP